MNKNFDDDLRIEESIAKLIHSLREKNGNQRQIITALVQIGEKAVNPLITMLNDTDNNVFRTVASLLVEIGDLRAVPPLIQVLQNALTDEARANAATALGCLGDYHAINALTTAALSAPHFEVRSASVQALARIGGTLVLMPILRALKDTNQNVRQTATIALGNLNKSHLNPVVTRQLEKIVEEYIAQLSSQSRSDRQIAAYMFGQLKDRKAVPILTECIVKDPSDEIKGACVTALSNIEDVDSTRTLLTALDSDSSTVRWQAAFALGQVGDESALTQLTNLLMDQNPIVRSEAARAISKIRSKSNIG